ncbi:Hypothetical_protein [Hexamita inflata]|uniref:Hypothetical_protein n=1 Tax=Hexamita inflata TaxID=28002 RepID=A0AA86QGD3_9EUKA|nr:Hypothetical protein HINF_LOCUS43845 [Hexamita inflata]CAI9958215.1 Hypothetical protein HINF_LOCUS45860 [Hexamita inflata]
MTDIVKLQSLNELMLAQDHTQVYKELAQQRYKLGEQQKQFKLKNNIKSTDENQDYLQHLLLTKENFDMYGPNIYENINTSLTFEHKKLDNPIKIIESNSRSDIAFQVKQQLEDQIRLLGGTSDYFMKKE